eukprot:TRINITY_DN14901_c0_g1_i1.p1 TRINITY_DN14901_c0_g1~~TRINITY_DN14901_c0_g1_i1.p1  ORF type:complete len:379 (+),score=64.36 TRINITY_DN14901_c0_g1_i1:187-1323(+)
MSSEMEGSRKCCRLQSMDSPADCGKVSKEYLQGLLHALAHGAFSAKIEAAEEIRRLTKKSSKIRSYLAATPVTSTLASLLSSPESQAKEAALLALINLAVGNERNKVRIVNSGALEPLVNILQCDDKSLRESGAAAVLTLSATPVTKSQVGSSGVIPPLVEILVSGSIQGKTDALMALCNLSVGTENLENILTSGALSPLIKILKDCNKNSKFAEKTTALIESLLTLEGGRIELAKEEGAILALVEAAEEGSAQSREHAVGALLNLCRTHIRDYRQHLLKEGVIPGVLELTVHGTPRAQQRAKALLQLLRDFSASPKAYTSPDVIESIVCNIASHVDDPDQGFVTAKQILAEMVQLSMERSMKHLQRRARLSPKQNTT